MKQYLVLFGLLLVGALFAATSQDGFTEKQYNRADDCYYASTRQMLNWAQNNFCTSPDMSAYRDAIQSTRNAARSAAEATNDCFNGGVDPMCLAQKRKAFMSSLRSYYGAVNAGRFAYVAEGIAAVRNQCADPPSKMANRFATYNEDVRNCIMGPQ